MYMKEDNPSPENTKGDFSREIIICMGYISFVI